jgi:hypothetical protein
LVFAKSKGEQCDNTLEAGFVHVSRISRIGVTKGYNNSLNEIFEKEGNYSETKFYNMAELIQLVPNGTLITATAEEGRHLSIVTSQVKAFGFRDLQHAESCVTTIHVVFSGLKLN